MAKITWLSLAFCGWTVVTSAQNMTDLAVMNDKSADRQVLNIGTNPPVADTVFLHPDRIRYDHRCFQIEGKDVFISAVLSIISGCPVRCGPIASEN